MKAAEPEAKPEETQAPVEEITGKVFRAPMGGTVIELLAKTGSDSKDRRSSPRI